MTFVEAAASYRVARAVGSLLGWLFRRWPTLARGLATGIFPALGDVGFVTSFEGRQAARGEIEKSLARSENVWILSNKGDDWLGDRGLLKDAILAAKAKETRLKVYTILGHRASPWLLSRGLKYLNKKRAVVEREYRTAHEAVSRWCSEVGLEPPRYHKHDPAWRFVCTDAHLFLSTYVTHEQMENRPLLQFNASSPIYKSVRRYFDHLYEFQSAPEGELSVFERSVDKPLTVETSAGMILIRDTSHGPEVLLTSKTDEAFTIPKGHIENGEAPEAAAYRELEEETGLELDRLDLRLTGFYVTAHTLPGEILVKNIAVYSRMASSREACLPLAATARWVPCSNLPTLRIAYDYVRSALRDAGAWESRVGPTDFGRTQLEEVVPPG